jgi:hypothetical protein
VVLDYPTQGIFLLGLHIGRANCRRHGTSEERSSSHRQATICYSVPNGTSDVDPVCKSTFMAIFSVGKKRRKFLSVKREPVKLHSLTKVQDMHQADLQKKTEIVLETT